ncbi:MAG: DUF4232 domain-containing protein [Terrimesophilobacter sp.]
MRNSHFLTLSVATAVLLAGCTSTSVPQGSEPSAPTSPAQTSEPPASTPPAAPPQSVPSEPEQFTAGAPDGQCLTENLTVAISDPDGSAGKLHYELIITNTGSECVLEGFPRVQVTSGGSPIGAAASEDSSTPPVSLSLTRGGTTYAALTMTNIGSGGGPLGTACTVAQGDALAVTPPHSMIAISVPMDVPA